MTFKVDVKARGTGRVLRAVMAMSLLALAACGGGTQVERFVPTRVIAFGDENSLIEADGRKYTVNGFNTATPPALDCTVNPIWTQYVAGQWGLYFPQCSAAGTAPSSRIHAVNGAKVAGLTAQIASAGTLGEKDLATVFVGANDIFDIYAQCIGCNEVVLTEQAQAAGTALAAQIATIVRAGAKVVFLTVPELGATPYARQQELTNPGAAGLLNRLTAAFNSRLRTGVSNPGSSSFIDGHQGVQVLADDLFRSVVSAVGTTATGYVNASDGICNLPAGTPTVDCNTTTLLTASTTPALTVNGTTGTYLWADAKHLSPGGHSALGTTAANRINANPL